MDLEGKMPSGDIDVNAPDVSVGGGMSKLNIAGGIAAGAAAVGGIFKLGGKGDAEVTTRKYKGSVGRMFSLSLTTPEQSLGTRYIFGGKVIFLRYAGAMS